MNKSTPLAKFMRTFMSGAAATLLTVLAVLAAPDSVVDWKATATALVLGLIAALVAGVAAGLLAVKFAAETPAQRALFQFCQYVGGGLVAVPVLAAFEKAAVFTFGHAIGRLVLAGVVSAAITFAQNYAEDTPPASRRTA